MTRTAIMTGQGSALGALQLGGGAPRPTIAVIEWIGPFDPAEVMMRGRLNYDRVARGSTETTANLDQFDSIRVSDPAWWTVTG